MIGVNGNPSGIGWV